MPGQGQTADSEPARPGDAVGSPGQLPALRAADADRERAAEHLRHAAGEGRLSVDELDERLTSCYAAKTVAELEVLTADVVVAGHETVGAMSASGRAPAVRPGAGGTGAIVAIMGGNDRKGRWRVAPRLKVVNVMGGSDIDLTEAELSDQVTRISVFSLMGGGSVRVPDGADVQVSKFAFMGGHDIKLSPEAPPPGAPVIQLRMISIMGGCEVRQGPKRRKRKRDELAGGRDQLERGRDRDD